MQSPAERREFQRLDLPEPLEATFNGVPVAIVDLGVLGAGVAHEEHFDDAEGRLVLSWDDNEIMLDAGVVRTVDRREPLGEFKLHSGIRFFRAIGDSDAALRSLLATVASREIERRGAGRPRREAAELDEPLRYDAPFVSFLFDGRVWSKRPVHIPEQPSDGFTLPVDGDQAEMTRLCLAYEIADPEGQRLIRLFAELSVSESLGIPLRKTTAAASVS